MHNNNADNTYTLLDIHHYISTFYFKTDIQRNPDLKFIKKIMNNPEKWRTASWLEDFYQSARSDLISFMIITSSCEIDKEAQLLYCLHHSTLTDKS